MVKCLNIGKNIGKPIYRSISSNFLRSRIWAAKEPLIDFGRLRLAGLIGPIYRELLSGVRKHVQELASWPLGGRASVKAGPKSSESEAAVNNTSSSPKETVSHASGLGYK